jgi:hypothetical protein
VEKDGSAPLDRLQWFRQVPRNAPGWEIESVIWLAAGSRKQ